LVRIGVDELAGAATGDIDALAERRLCSYPVADFAGLARARAHRAVQVLDVRRTDEYAGGYVDGCRHVPLHELTDRVDEVPRGEVWVYCGSGYRASIAASILDRLGRQVVLINDAYDVARLTGLEQSPRTVLTLP
jgi:rhodanese-related sulfurtransferase